MPNLDTMRELVKTCPWLKADNLLDAVHSNEAYQNRLAKCWRALINSGDEAALDEAVTLWQDAGVVLSVEFIKGVYLDKPK